jgi:hypothetical protein
MKNITQVERKNPKGETKENHNANARNQED